MKVHRFLDKYFLSTKIVIFFHFFAKMFDNIKFCIVITFTDRMQRSLSSSALKELQNAFFETGFASLVPEIIDRTIKLRLLAYVSVFTKGGPLPHFEKKFFILVFIVIQAPLR